MVEIGVMRLAGADAGVPLPGYATAGAAGMDVRANLPDALRETGMVLPAGGRGVVPTGVALEIPEGFEVQIRPRSGLALHHGVTVLNAPGTIDSDYRGPLGVLLVNLSDADFTIAHGMRIAQMVAAPVAEIRLAERAGLSGSARGAGGFGSTGT